MGALAQLINSVAYRDVPVALSRATERRVRRFLDDVNESFSRMDPPEELIPEGDPGLVIGISAALERGLFVIDSERDRKAGKKPIILIGRREKMKPDEISEADLVIELDPEHSAGRVTKYREGPEDLFIVDVVL